MTIPQSEPRNQQFFTMLVGLPASGKSTVAAQLHDQTDAVVHSSDAIRAELLGDENDQSQQELVFRTLQTRALQDLSAGKNVVYDATNLNYRRRMDFLRRVKALKLPDFQSVCYFVLAPYEECLFRNASRERAVPEAVLRQMYEHIDIPMEVEGWDKIQLIFTEGYAGDTLSLLSRLSKLEQDNPHHKFTVGQHCILTQQYLSSHYSQGLDPCLFSAAVLHDIGKEKTKVFLDTKGNPSEIAHFYDHERVGAYDSFFYTLKAEFTTSQCLETALLVRWHMYPFVVEKSQSPAKTESKIVRLLGQDIWSKLLILNDCDRHAH